MPPARGRRRLWAGRAGRAGRPFDVEVVHLHTVLAWISARVLAIGVRAFDLIVGFQHCCQRCGAYCNIQHIVKMWQHQ